jgi:hypothetical protein
MNEKDREYISKLSLMLDKTPRFGPHVGEPAECNRYIMISDNLARIISKDLRKIAQNNNR